MKKHFCRRALLGISLAALCPVVALASLPVNHKSEGCVIKGRVYSIYQAKTAYAYSLPKGFDLKPYEGKKVLLEGELSPGDAFVPKDKALKILGACDAATRKLIPDLK